MEAEKNVIDARDMLLTDNVMLIDVRSPEQFEKRNIANSINIPLSRISQDMPKLDVKKTYLLICNDGALSRQALKVFEACRFKSHVIRGGMQDWMRVFGV